MTTAFVLSGGASLGSLQVGMLQGLVEAGITPDLIVGTSVGAVNGGWIAGRGDLAGIAALGDLWRTLSRQSVFPTRPLTGLLGFLGRRPNLVPDSGLRRLLAEHLRFTRLEDAPVPLYVVATDVCSGRDVLLSRGDAIDAIVASASIPAVFPPVEIDGRTLMDGGVVNNTPISHAIDLGADTIWVIPTGAACGLPAPPVGALPMALHALNLTVNQRLAVDIAHYETSVNLHVVPPLCPVQVSPADFSHADELITSALAVTRTWLDNRLPSQGQATLLEPHAH